MSKEKNTLIKKEAANIAKTSAAHLVAEFNARLEEHCDSAPMVNSPASPEQPKSSSSTLLPPLVPPETLSPPLLCLADALADNAKGTQNTSARYVTETWETSKHMFNGFVIKRRRTEIIGEDNSESKS